MTGWRIYLLPGAKKSHEMNIVKSSAEYEKAYNQSIQDRDGFWSEIADDFVWRKKWDSVCEADFFHARFSWFSNAKLNITENCLDRHLEDRGDQTAIIWEANNPDEDAKHISYKKLHQEVCRLANALKSLGVKKGDRVCLYMPMVPELAYAVLGCARVGAIHSVVFAGFSAQSLADRINDASCKWVMTADGSFRGAKTLNLKKIVDDALDRCSSVAKVLVLKRTGEPVDMKPGRDIWWNDALKGQASECDVEIMDAEDPLFILYTSGSTGKPKGMVHSCGGYMVYTVYSFKTVFQYQDGEIYWCTADIGWVTGHSYIVYGPLLAGATTIMFEGVPSFPDMGRFWDVIDKHKVNIFYTAPTAIRALQGCDQSLVRRSDLNSLRVLGTVGEPINAEAWEWYKDEIGHEHCAVVDTWWQTETGGIMISPIANVTKTKACYATLPLPGVVPVLFDAEKNLIEEPDIEGRLCLSAPWPSMARTIYGDHQRYIDTYFSQFPGNYFTGDGAKRDEEGNYRIIGRVDDVLIVSGHNLGTAEIESAIDEHEDVSEAAIVGFPHPIKGNAVCAFVQCSETAKEKGVLIVEIKALVSEIVGPIARPDRVIIVPALPKTRSGKIMRRILRKLASDDTENLGDISTLLNPEAVQEIMDVL